MQDFYVALFVGLGLFAAVLESLQVSWVRPGNADPRKCCADVGNSDYKKFRNNYVLIYGMMMGGDWLQGPYVYSLYEQYGYTVKDIGRLFIVGFGSSMVFGTIVGALADRHGRKRAAMLYIAVYSLSCMTKHSPNYWVLLVGRLLGGIATSLLFSAFEAWVVAEHNSRGYDEKLLGDIFSKAVLVGNGLMAIVAGLVGNYLVEDMGLGRVAPFDAAIVVLMAGGAMILASWDENYGDQSHHGGVTHQFKLALAAIYTDRRIALLGVMQSLFEASMYTFVFLWTPALSPRGEKLPHGLIFANFMAASMVGSALVGLLIKRYRVESYMRGVFVVSAATMVVPLLYHTELHSHEGQEGVELADYSSEQRTQMLAFCVFEVMIGMFWPSMMAMRAVYVPEDLRSTILNTFRMPLNLFVCLILFKVDKFPLAVMFGLCSIFLAIAAVMQEWLLRLAQQDSLALSIQLAGQKDPLLASQQDGPEPSTLVVVDREHHSNKGLEVVSAAVVATAKNTALRVSKRPTAT